MLSYRLTRFGQPLESATGEIPVPEGTQVVLRVSGCGVCHSDIHQWDGYFDYGNGERQPFGAGEALLPITPGHEIAGEVVALGPEAAGVSPGDRRVVFPWIGCGKCLYCRTDREHICSRPRSIGIDVDGGYAEYVVVPHPRYLIDYSGIPMELACTFACSGLTAYSALKKLGRLGEGESLMILGAGGVGLAAVRLAREVTGVAPVVAEIDAGRRRAALDAGASEAVDPSQPETAKQILGASGGGLAAAIDFVGSEATVQFGLRTLRKGGRLIVVGLYGGALNLPIPRLPFRSLTITGSYVGSLEEMRELVKLAQAGHVQPIPLSSRPLREASETLADLKAGRVVGRVVLRP